MAKKPKQGNFKKISSAISPAALRLCSIKDDYRRAKDVFRVKSKEDKGIKTVCPLSSNFGAKIAF
ncbi:MAG: hypothetical protein LH472_01415 [Pyrinomonadaceae bacterium]|nr:hypothetical protein [Pyrinomonadaceae bacterium]